MTHKEWDIQREAIDSKELIHALQHNYEPFAVKYTPNPVLGNRYIVWLKKNIIVEED